MRLQFRAEMFNTFNHPQFYAPQFGGESYTGCDPNAPELFLPALGQITNSFPSRTVQFAGNSIGDRCLKICLKLAAAGFADIPAGIGQQNQQTNLESLLANAKQAQASGDYAAAASAYKQAVYIRPEIAELWANLGLMQHQTGDYAQAIQSFQKARKLKPSLYVPTLFLGVDLRIRGRQRKRFHYCWWRRR